MEYRKLKDLKKLPNNPRTIKDESFKSLCKSIQDNPDYFEARPVILSDRTGELIIIAGNQRYEAAKHLKLSEIPTHLLSGLTEEREKEIIIRDNVANGEWDLNLLADWDKVKLEEWGVDVEWTVEEPEATEDDYEIPDTIETDIILGDLFEIGDHRLLCGDSTDSDAVAKLMNGDKADMVFTDPPYGMNYESNAWDSKKIEVKQKRTDTQILNDNNTSVGIDALNLMPLFLNNDRHFYIWCRWDCFSDFKKVSENIGKIKSVIVWDKGGPGLGDLKGSYGDSEWAIFGMIGRRELKERQNGVWQVNRMKGLQMQHPTQKPIEICERGITNSTNANELILDFFLGSGSTMVASHQLNRKCYGMELDPKYCQVIIDRMKKLDPNLIIKKNGEVI